MISDRTMLRVASAVFIVGFVALFFISQQNVGKTVQIAEISETMLGERVSVQGVITNIRQGNNLIMILVDENDNSKMIKVVLFDNNVELENGDFVVVRGEISIFRGDLEITATKISKIE